MKRIVLKYAALGVFLFTFQVTALANAKTLMLSDYWVAGDAGDSWTYTFTEPSMVDDFTVYLTSTTDGTLRIGDFVYDLSDAGNPYLVLSTWSTFDLVGDMIRLHSAYNPFYGLSIYDPPLELPTTVETDQLLSSSLPLTLFSAEYLLFKDSITVQAGTFSNILIAISLCDDIPNNFNTLFNLDPTEVPYAVTGVTWYAKGVGLVKAIDVDSGDLIADIEFDYELTNVCEGDFDGDGDVDGSDLAVFAADFGRTDCSDDCEGDFDNDGDVDGSDLAVFAAYFGRTDCPISE